MENQVKNWSIIILAAGRSERMGSLKQLLSYNGKTLLEYAADEAIASGAETVTIVLGYEADRIIAQTQITEAHVVLNSEWESGMASSIVSGMKMIMKDRPETDAVILMVCDQPFADASLLKRLIAKQKETGKPIIACEYGGVVGVPALFCKNYFAELLGSKGDLGAKKIISQHTDAVATISFPLGSIDIDTPEAYQKLGQNVI